MSTSRRLLNPQRWKASFALSALPGPRIPRIDCIIARMTLTRIRPLLLAALCLLPAQTIFGSVHAEDATLPAAPELLGFRLGMTRDEIKELVPQTVFGKAGSFRRRQDHDQPALRSQDRPKEV